MKQMNDSGFTGLEAAIVLIAFVVVAAVFSYVILGAGFFTTQKAQETIYKGIEQSTSNLQLIGNVYGIGDENGIEQFRLTIGLAPGAPTLNLKTMKIVFSTPAGEPSSYGYSVVPAVGAFTPTEDFISPGGQVDIRFNVTPVVKGGDKLTIELRPAAGAALPFTKTAPAVITPTTILY